MTYGSSDHYTEEKGQKYFAYQNKLGELAGKLNVWKFQPYIAGRDSILDFGCGGGWLLREIALPMKYGVELNPAARSCCASLGIQAFESISDLPENLCFDIIISHHALEHVPHPIGALRELHGRIKKTGIMIIILPIDDWRVQADYAEIDIDHHLHTWTPRLFANTLTEAGFNVEKIKVMAHAWPPFVSTLCHLPGPIFNTICTLWSILRHRRQLLAVATPRAI